MCVRIKPKGSQHFLQNGVMTWSYTSDVGMMHLVVPFFLQIAVGDAIVQVAKSVGVENPGDSRTAAYDPWTGKCPWYCKQRSNQQALPQCPGCSVVTLL